MKDGAVDNKHDVAGRVIFITPVSGLDIFS